MKCCLSTPPISDADAVRRAKSWQDMAGADYVKDVSVKAPYPLAGSSARERVGRLHAHVLNVVSAGHVLHDFARRTASASVFGGVLRQHFMAPLMRSFSLARGYRFR
jgi:carbamoylphosphate synthase small subunit